MSINNLKLCFVFTLNCSKCIKYCLIITQDEANPINQPVIIDMSSDKVPNNALVPQNDTSSTQVSHQYNAFRFPMLMLNSKIYL